MEDQEDDVEEEEGEEEEEEEPSRPPSPKLLRFYIILHMLCTPEKERVTYSEGVFRLGLVASSVAFFTRGSGMGKKSGSESGMQNPDHISERLETIFWVKILKFFDAAPGWEKIRIRDPGWRKFGSGIQDIHPGSAIPVARTLECGSRGA